MSEDVAQAQLDAMEEEFGAIDHGSADTIFEAIKRGNIDFDETTGEVTYTLQRPPEVDNPAVDVSRVVLREPGASEMEKVSKGLTVTANKDGTMQLDSSFATRQAVRLVTYVGGWPAGLADRIKRRDIQVIQALASFFG